MAAAFINAEEYVFSVKAKSIKVSKNKLDKWEKEYLKDVLDYQAY